MLQDPFELSISKITQCYSVFKATILQHTTYALYITGIRYVTHQKQQRTNTKIKTKQYLVLCVNCLKPTNLG